MFHVFFLQLFFDVELPHSDLYNCVSTVCHHAVALLANSYNYIKMYAKLKKTRNQLERRIIYVKYVCMTQGLKSPEDTGVIMVHPKKDLLVQKWGN